MDGRLWTRLYREIRRARKTLTYTQRTGRPRMYDTDEILAVWAFAALMDWPISVTQRRPACGAAGWWLRRHWKWPMQLPLVAPLNLRGAKC
ncbi:MAG: hypothetical protein SVV80_07305 [Planctomycetota bacterium]|nr:hypothetical protein [Planctomycetota bacterium]